MDDSLLPLEQARPAVLGSIQPLAPIELPLAEAHGCVLAQDVTAEFDSPPFSTAEVEGYAARAADVHGATAGSPVLLRLAGQVVGGHAPEVTVGWGEAVRVAEGAVMPGGGDCVVPVERCEAEGDQVRVLSAAQAGAFVRPAGEDMRAGDVLIPAGRKLAAPELALLAAAGRPAAPAFPKVRVAVIPVGAGLVEPGRQIGVGQIRDAASYAVFGAIVDLGATPYRVSIVSDSVSGLREAIQSNLLRADCLVVTGGLSESEGDSPGLSRAGIGEIDVYRVAMYPGMTLEFGLVESTPLFAVSGQPLSALVSFEVFVRPALLKMMGRRDLARPEVAAVLDEEVTGPAGVTLFAPARVERRDGRWHARPTGAVSLTTVVESNGLAVIPPGDTSVRAGEEVRVLLLRVLER